ncbi:hypothetical protein [Nocardia ninae]|uniref:Uncharacterized protein n=1 Tax=Nocardia ninae NBRC 108245 TaxID=1210091 RepID=A0A511MLZ4_9NOCA|nr:hypothetical protein [Nocardia ninae]GEM41157.1 hypothetical protein NN4_56760 [Nocardia ninae NBRC 108245]
MFAVACTTAAACASTGQAHAEAVAYRSCGEVDTVTGLEISDNRGNTITFHQNTTYDLAFSFTPEISIPAEEGTFFLYAVHDATGLYQRADLRGRHCRHAP